MGSMELVRIVIEAVAVATIGFLQLCIQKRLEATEEKEKQMQAELAAERERVEEMRKANNKGTHALLRDRLLQGFHFFKKRGMVTYGEAMNYKNMYEAYHALGKNGVMDGIYEEFLKIPIKPDAEVYPNEQIGGAA
ncbi:MAG: hypothetical protein IJ741_06925 [Schwartzia sp.]|nr:hypothetical protein [Schwartzia sp. (in: firmicutes)]